MKGAKVAAMPKTLMSMMRLKTPRSSSHSVSVPAETPALAMMMSGTPNLTHENPMPQRVQGRRRH
jgi:hypothetical protein